MGRPPYGVITNVYVEADAKSQFAVKFELLDTVSNELMPVIANRHKAEEASLDFPYSPPLEEDERAPAKSNNKLRGQKGAKAKGRK
jgi:hypothetical protein